MDSGNVSRCTGNCMKCVAFQRQFCASQLAYNNMKALEAMASEVKSMREKIEALQDNEASLFDPTQETAQQGDGAIE